MSPNNDVPSADEAATPAAPGAPRLHPEHLYKAIGLALLLSLLYRFFDPVTRVLLVAFAAGILAVAFNAIVSRLPGGRTWMTALIGLLVFLLLGTAVFFGGRALVKQIRGFSQQAPQFEQTVREWEQSIKEETGLNVSLMGKQSQSFVRSFFTGGEGKGGSAMVGRALGILEVVALPLIILFGGLFAVGKPNERLLSPVLRAVPRERRPAFHRMFELLGVRLLGWVKGTLLAMLIIGALSTLAFYLIGLQYALLLGVWSGLTEFVPIIGPIVGGGTAVIAAFLQDPSKALFTGIAVVVIQQIESNLVTPLVMAKVADVHPFVTLFAIMLFGSLFGFLGVLLSLPIVLVVWTVVQVLWVERAIDTDEDPVPAIVED